VEEQREEEYKRMRGRDWRVSPEEKP